MPPRKRPPAREPAGTAPNSPSAARDAPPRVGAPSPAPVPENATPERCDAQFELVGEICQEIRDAVEKILAASADERKELVLSAQERLVALRGAQCAALSGLDHLKTQTRARDVEVDPARTRAGTAAYEMAMLERELQDVKGDVDGAKDTGGIELMELAAYEADARARGLLEENASTDAYELTTKRLAHELIVRRELVEKQKALKAELAALQTSIEERKKMLGKNDTIRQLKRNAEELRRRFDLPYSTSAALERRMSLLPTAMYVLYAQLKHAQQMSEDLDVKVLLVGHIGDAEAYEARDAEEGEVAAKDDDDDSHRAKRPRSGGKQRRGGTASAEGATTSAPSMYAEHPLRVELVFGQKKVIFSYLTKLHAIVARAQGVGGDPLGELFPGDDGSTLPNQAVEVVDQNFTFDLSSVSHGAKPYKWAQDLAGMSFISSVPSKKRDENLDSKRITAKANALAVVRALEAKFAAKI